MRLPTSELCPFFIFIIFTPYLTTIKFLCGLMPYTNIKERSIVIQTGVFTMKKVLILYASSTGNTEQIASLLEEEIDRNDNG